MYSLQVVSTTLLISSCIISNHLLLCRYIDQQQNEAGGAPVIHPNAVNKIQAENEMLENTLRQQNALLRQILLEREREMRLETQSLPAGTQTDHDTGTQTEPLFLRPPRRKTRSDNDASDYSDEEENRFKKRSRKTGRIIRRKINTPIQEESETNLENEKQQGSANENRRLSFGHTKTSLLRKKAIDDKKPKSRSALRREVLKEISASLFQSDGSESDSHYKYHHKGYSSEDSQDDVSPQSEKSSMLRRLSESSRSEYKSSKRQSQAVPERYHSEIDLRNLGLQGKTFAKEKSRSQLDLQKRSTQRSSKRVSRYMDWYKKNGSKKKNSEETAPSSATSRVSAVSKRVMQETQTQMTASNKNRFKSKIGPEHPLLQHSERRFEAQLNRRPDDDGDSGIALARPNMTQKKSVFTIAYDDIQTKQLRQDSATPPL